MADVDVSQFDDYVRHAVDRRGLFLLSPDSDPAVGLMPEQQYVFVSRNSDPNDVGFSAVGHVVAHRGAQLPLMVFALDGGMSMGSPSRQQIRTYGDYFWTWEEGIMAVLAAYDEHSWLYSR
ncbi:hypothetical protein [Streptomyces sp. NPDC057689]|uniref:hypothetical protein n=1 Tax=Streptomyces sp. NPDC057689 TaxID=3346213 RepID=UPI00368CE863